MRIAVIGAGSWGTALAAVAAGAGRTVSLWSRRTDVVESVNSAHINPVYLSFASLPPGIRATTDLNGAVRDAAIVVLAVPSHATRAVLERMRNYVSGEVIFVGAMKGLEIESGKRMSEVAAEVFEEEPRPRYVCLSGPSFAKEVLAGHPTAIVAAGHSMEACKLIQQQLSFQNLRIYTNADLVGVELGGATKNVMAIASGMAAGLGFGFNSIAALITRGLAEMTRLALTMGAKQETLMGLAGLGDLVLTCTGNLSRNRFVGEELGKGRKLSDICTELNEVAEGINTTRAVKRLAHEAQVDVPITSEVYDVLYDHKPPREAVAELMTRPLREEFE
jgi:glycerol-3-phosphate dehydrogenase (NAD(P)+)